MSTPAVFPSLLAASLCSLAAPALSQSTARVSVGSGGAQPDGDCLDSSISATGRFVAFASDATTLVPGDVNQAKDIFVRDRALRTTTLVSVSTAGHQGNYDSYYPAISADGRFVAFSSGARSLVPVDTNHEDDVFVHDRLTHVTTRVSVDSSGAQADGQSTAPSISADGRYVAFHSLATNLVAGDTNGVHDAFVHDRLTGITTRVSVSSTGAEGPSTSLSPALSADGRRVVFESGSSFVANDTDVGGFDVYVRDLANGTTTCVNLDPNGTPADGGAPEISGDGRFVSFVSSATNLVPNDTNGQTDIFVRDLDAGVTSIASVGTNGVQANAGSSYHSLSYHGRFVVFSSPATTFLAVDANGDAKDIFLRDRAAGTTTLVSANSFGVQANDRSSQPSISADGRHIVFYSMGTNMAHGDTNGAIDVFVRDLP